MPVLEDYGTLKDVSLEDMWTVENTLTKFANYERLGPDSGTKNCSLPSSSFLKFPFYHTMKCAINGSSSRHIDVQILYGEQYWQWQLWPTKVRDSNSGSYFLVDMTTPHIVTVLFPAADQDARLYLDGDYKFDIERYYPYSENYIFRITSISAFTETLDLYYQRIHSNPIALLDYLWLAFLQKRVMDPEDRDDPNDFISKRFPAASFPTEILKPRIDYHIRHNTKTKPSQDFPHFYVDSTVTISAYIKKDTIIEGLQNVDIMDLLCSLIQEALHYVKDDIPCVKDYTVGQPVFRFDERNRAWTGKIEVRVLHFVEVF